MSRLDGCFELAGYASWLLVAACLLAYAWRTCEP